MSANPPGSPSSGDKKGKRMLPSVSDVVRELQGSSSAEPGLLFKAARQVCADELARVKQGFEAAPVEVLVDRARVLLDPSLAAPAPTDLGSLFEPAAAPAAPSATPPAPATPRPPAAVPSSDEPFSETSGALDLKWEGEPPATSAAGPPTEIVSLGNFQPLREPGEETLAGLEREAHALNLPPAGSDEPWRGAQVPLATSAPPPPEETGEGADEPVISAPRAGRSPLLLAAVAIGLLAVGFFGWRLLSDRLFGSAKPTSVPYPVARRKRPAATPGARAQRAIVLPEEGAAPATASTASAAPARTAPSETTAGGPTKAPVPSARPAAAPTPASVVAQARPPRAPAAAPTEAPRPTPAPTPTYRLAGGILAARPPARPAEEPARAAATSATSAAPVAPAASPAASRPSPAARVAAAPASARSAAAARPRAQVMRSPDWAGQAGVYVVHFTSYRDRKPAALDAARLQQKLGKPAHAVQVDLGAKGVWYRAVAGDFATVEEARAYRQQLAEAGTPNLGLVYYLEGPQSER